MRLLVNSFDVAVDRVSVSRARRVRKGSTVDHWQKNRLLNTTALSPLDFKANTTASKAARGHRRRPIATTVQASPNSFGEPLLPTERGIVLSAPMEIAGNQVRIINSSLDLSEIRRSLLFWDRIAWPVTNGLHLASNQDETYLQSIGKLVRPSYAINGGMERGLGLAAADAYVELDRRNPGQWAVSDGHKRIILEDQRFGSQRGIVASLVNAIPVPDRDVPLNDILEFREKRLDEIAAFNFAIDDFYQSWVNSEDQDHSFQMALAQIDNSCKGLVLTTREWGLKTLLSNWKVGFSFSAKDVMTATAYFLAAQHYQLPTVSSIAAGALSFVSFNKDLGMKQPASDLSPFRFSVSMEKEMW